MAADPVRCGLNLRKIPVYQGKYRGFLADVGKSVRRGFVLRAPANVFSQRFGATPILLKSQDISVFFEVS